MRLCPSKAMTNQKSKRSPAIYAISAWMIINAIFFLLEITILNDSADLNNSISLVLFVLSIIGLLSMRKIGAAFTTFTLTYAFSFNAFNVIYFPETRVLNGASAILNAIAIAFMFKGIFSGRFR